MLMFCAVLRSLSLFATESGSVWMTKNGWAIAYRSYSRDYVKSESIAKRKRLNIWQGNFIYPWTWREQRDERMHWEWQSDFAPSWPVPEKGKYWAWKEKREGHSPLTYF